MESHLVEAIICAVQGNQETRWHDTDLKKLIVLLDSHTWIGTQSYRVPSYVVKIIHSTNI